MPSRTSSTGRAEPDGGAGAVRNGALARKLRETLGLRLPPVALAFVTETPDGVEAFADEVPSACTFWRRAETSVFFASAAAHAHCPIGALTMGFSMSPEEQEQLMSLVGSMAERGYVAAEEAANIPSVPGEKHGIVYGPLEHLPLEPDAVLLWVSGRSAMLLGEATRASEWTHEASGTGSFGRPSCAAIPVAVRDSAPAFSVGCAGMRTFTEIGDDLQLAVLPRASLDGLDERLEATVRVNEEMLGYYAGQKARYETMSAGGS